MIWNEILCLGDSITFGARDRYRRSYPLELAKILFEETGEFYYCHNFSTCGDTSSDLASKVWGAVSSYKNSKIAVIMIGTNDTQVSIPVDIYEDNLRQIIMTVKIAGMIPILVTLPQLGKTPLYIKNKDYIKKYNKVLYNLSKTLGCEICDASRTEEYYIDGVHYTHEGYKVLAKRIANNISSLCGFS